MAFAREYLGGRCVECGSTKGLEFDHVDPLRKRGDVTQMWSYSLKTFMAEVEGCELRCREHHAEKTAADKRGYLRRLREKARRDAEDPVPF